MGLSPPDAQDGIGICSAALVRAFGLLGKRWTGLILAALAEGPIGYANLRRAVAGIGDSMLTERLGGLADARLVARLVDPGPPVAVTYRLTPSGQALVPALIEIRAWAEVNLAG